MLSGCKCSIIKFFFVYIATNQVFSDALPECQIDTNINLIFYSSTSPSEGIRILDPNDVITTTFSNENHTFVCIHGWLGSVKSNSCLSIKNTLLQKEDLNVFIVDWDKIAENWLYPMAFVEVEKVGNHLGCLLNGIVNNSGLDLGMTSIIGHSLGAHVAGVAGIALDGKLNYIVGLDPAGPLFTRENTNNRLTTSSAKFVQAIHTCGAVLGYFVQMGHADYYPNGGKIQPMCNVLDVICSHFKAFDYYIESLQTGNFKATQCKSYSLYRKGKCSNGKESMMGEFEVDKSARGTYFLDTNRQPPYAKNENNQS